MIMALQGASHKLGHFLNGQGAKTSLPIVMSDPTIESYKFIYINLL